MKRKLLLCAIQLLLMHFMRNTDDFACKEGSTARLFLKCCCWASLGNVSVVREPNGNTPQGSDKVP